MMELKENNYYYSYDFVLMHITIFKVIKVKAESVIVNRFSVSLSIYNSPKRIIDQMEYSKLRLSFTGTYHISDMSGKLVEKYFYSNLPDKIIREVLRKKFQLIIK